MAAVDPAPTVAAALLRSLVAMRDGDFSVRLPQDWVGLNGKIADTFNDIISASARMAHELERMGDVIGKEGNTTQRVKFARSDGAWGQMETSINTLVDKVLWPTRAAREAGSDVGPIVEQAAEPDTGTDVIVGLPALAAAPAPAPATSAVVDDTPQPSARTRILVVDDNGDAAFVLALRLRHAGHTVEIAGNGEQALRTGPTFNPRVVLLDLGMPGIDGFEAARRIRQQRWGQDVVLVAVTGWGLPEDRRRTQAAGFNAHLVKPVDDEELLRLLDDLIARPSA